jgi:hypothetical protein
MSIGQIVSKFSNAVCGTKVFWMRDVDGRKVSVLAIIPESCRQASAGLRSKEMAERAERVASQEAGRMGPITSKGVFMGGNGNGSVVATGIAEMLWSPEIERRLYRSGIPQLR